MGHSGVTDDLKGSGMSPCSDAGFPCRSRCGLRTTCTGISWEGLSNSGSRPRAPPAESESAFQLDAQAMPEHGLIVFLTLPHPSWREEKVATRWGCCPGQGQNGRNLGIPQAKMQKAQPARLRGNKCFRFQTVTLCQHSNII